MVTVLNCLKTENTFWLRLLKNLAFCVKTSYAKYGTGESLKPGKKKYRSTICLPCTEFPLRLDGEKRVERDIFIHKNCGFDSLYEWQQENIEGSEFVLHDGPPYANGKPHMGHAINKILKDITIRKKLLEGRRIHYVPGWDCHGLPIELKALGGQTNLSANDIRCKAEEFAREAIADQKEAFRSWGIMADWKNCYFTFDKQYIKNQLHQFWKLYEKGLVYRDMKPVFWSPSSRTALAEAELEYNSSHCNTAVMVRLQLKRLPNSIQDYIFSSKTTVYALVWTTTPWTLPMNEAVCFNPELTYSLVSLCGHTRELYIVAAELIDTLKAKFKKTIQVVTCFPGSSWCGSNYLHPLKPDHILPFLPAEHVTSSKGTGLVHTAPAHGQEDFLVAIQHSIPVECLVDEDGCYTEGAGPSLQGLPVLSQGSEAVLNLMATNIVHMEEVIHSYPYDWRTKQPVILRACQQWFIDTDTIKHRAMEALKEVKIYPEHGGCSRSGGGLITQLERRPYWCISRQRVWGVPVPVFYLKSSGKPLINSSLIDHLCQLLDEYGMNFWWTLPLDRIITEDFLEDQGLQMEEIEQGQDILDIWFDSGLSWYSVLGEDKTADLYLEGVDQFTGWFQSSLMTSIALRDEAPYRAIFVHGFAVDKEGRKMSKSLGNVVNPIDITHGGKNKKNLPAFGVDTLRWWVACHATQHSNIPVSQSIITTSAEAVHKIRIVLRFLLGNLHDYFQDGNEELYLLDQYLLHCLCKFHEQIEQAYEQYQLNRVCSLLINFVTNEVSSLYCHLIKDRLYCEPAYSSQRRSCQLVMNHILDIVIRAVAPVLPHLAEEVYLHHPSKKGIYLFRSGVIIPHPDWHQPEVAKVVNLALDVKHALNKISAFTNTQQLTVSIFASGEIYSFLKLLQNEEQSCWSELVEIMQVSSVRLVEDSSSKKFHLELAKTIHQLCSRCRRYTSETNSGPCSRCQLVLKDLSV